MEQVKYIHEKLKALNGALYIRATFLYLKQNEPELKSFQINTLANEAIFEIFKDIQISQHC